MSQVLVKSDPHSVDNWSSQVSAHSSTVTCEIVGDFSGPIRGLNFQFLIYRKPRFNDEEIVDNWSLQVDAVQ